jgi:glutamate/tyrosine decarboxylase-like PLP-dependent enzyme
VNELGDLLRWAANEAARYRAGLNEAAVYPTRFSAAEVRASLGELPQSPRDPAGVLQQLAHAVEPALVATTGPRYFGFVTGGALDAPTAAEVLVAGWDQVAFNPVTSPAAALVEEVAGAWLKDILGLPAGASYGFVTGAQAANTVALATARHYLLSKAGWDVESDGLTGAPPIGVVATGERHATIDRSLRLLGLGTACLVSVATDDSGAISIDALREALKTTAPSAVIVSLQAGNVNSGAFDDLARAIPIARQARRPGQVWVHVDGAFGLWAAASPSLRRLTEGMADADSWATDGHKWLNVPYDSGYVFTAHPEAHAASMSFTAAYLRDRSAEEIRGPSDYVPESSRRARGVATWAALAQLGREGIADLVDRCCRLARRFAAGLDGVAGIRVVNEVVLNQVLVSFGDAARTDEVIAAVQASGECWMGATTWRGQRLMRISVSSWRTTEADVDRSVEAIIAAATVVRPVSPK